MTSHEDLLRALAPQVLGALVRRYGNFDAAEDAVQEALIAAARRWPAGGLPADPRAWLVTVASRRLADAARSESARRRREDTVVARDTGPEVPDRDDTLTLLFLCCHPALTPPSAIGLTLRAVAGRKIKSGTVVRTSGCPRPRSSPPAGAPNQASGGDVSFPSPVCCLGIGLPSLNADD